MTPLIVAPPDLPPRPPAESSAIIVSSDEHQPDPATISANVFVELRTEVDPLIEQRPIVFKPDLVAAPTRDDEPEPEPDGSGPFGF
jgi:hypothetical protein